MSTRLTKAEKLEYKIGVTGSGAWAGVCPDCRRVFEASDPSVSQVGVFAGILRHRLQDHSTPGGM